MAQCKLAPQEFIQNAFSPMVAVLTSNDADALCQKNNLTFVELVQPFCKLNTEAHIKDPNGTVAILRNLRVTFQDINHRPPQATLAKKILSEAVNTIPGTERISNVQIGRYNLQVPLSTPWFEAWRETFLQVQYPSDHEFTKHYLACILVVSSSHANPLDQLQKLNLVQHQQQHQTPAKLPKWFSPSILKYYILLHDEIDGDVAHAEKVFESIKTMFGPNLCHMLKINSRPLGQADDQNHLPDPWSQFLLKRYEENDKLGSSSPCTPVEMAGLSDLPSHVTEGASEEGESVTNACVGQDATDLIFTPNHPLSPQQETSPSLTEKVKNKQNVGDKDDMTGHVNSNVWMSGSNIPSATTQHGACLSSTDIDRIRSFIYEFCTHALLPHVERQIRILHEAISNRKGVSRSFFSATKRFFGSNKPGNLSNSVIYSQEAPELQVRRLADLCFMFGHYSFAYQAYHSAKKDFNTDQAWMYYAGALEMAALAVFMSGEEQRAYPLNYMEESISTYLNSCRVPQFATRTTLLSTECLKSRGQYGDAAMQLIRMTNEESDLRSALLLEQAAYCFLNAKPPMVRKYSFHMILSGHRFSKASHRKHALRAYKQAFEVYSLCHWQLANDHIHFTVGRQSYNLHQLEVAVEAFASLLSPRSKQTAGQQSAFLREYLYMQQQLAVAKEGSPASLPVLPIPVMDSQSIQVITMPGFEYAMQDSAFGILSQGDENRWHKLEEMLIREAQGAPLIFKPNIQCFNERTNNTAGPVAPAGEKIHFELNMENSLQVPVVLSNISLLWEFKPQDSSDVICNESGKAFSDKVVGSVIESLVLEGNSTEKVLLSLTAHGPGKLNVLGIQYELSTVPPSSSPSLPNKKEQTASHVLAGPISGKQLFSIHGIRLNSNKAERCTPTYSQDRRLEVTVSSPMSALKVTFDTLPSKLYTGELQQVQVQFHNIGKCPLTDLWVGSTNPTLFAFASTSGGDHVPASLVQDKHIDESSGSVPQCVFNIPIPKTNSQLQPGDSFVLPMWIRGPQKTGTVTLELLFYHKTANSERNTRYRLVRHTCEITVVNVFSLRVIASRGVPNVNVPEALNILILIKNSQKILDLSDRSIRILQVSSASQSWCLSKKYSLMKDITLKPQEDCWLCLTAVWQKQEDSSKQCMFTGDIPLAKQSLDSLSAHPYVNFYKRHKWNVPDLSADPMLSAAPDGENTDSSEAVLKADPSTALTLQLMLALFWEITSEDNRTARGILYIDVDCLDKPSCWPQDVPVPAQPVPLHIFPVVPMAEDALMSSAYSDLTVMQKLVVFSMEHQTSVSHDFSRSRMCVVPVTVHLQNCCDLPLEVKINALGKQTPSYKNQMYSPHCSQVFRWVGRTVVTCQLNPHASTRVPLCVAITQPGTYNVGNLQVLSRPHDSGENDLVEQTWLVESPLIVHLMTN